MIGEIKIAPPSETGTPPAADQQATEAPDVKTPETAKIPENVATKNDIVTIEQRQGQLSKELQELQTMIRDVQQKTNSMFNVSSSLFNFQIKSYAPQKDIQFNFRIKVPQQMTARWSNCTNKKKRSELK